MAYFYTTQISEEDCIGDSLDDINDNFRILDEQIQGINQNYFVTYACETSGVGALNQVMSYGAGSTNLQGLRMLYDGVLIAASIQCTNIAGEVVVDAYLNNTPQSNYRLSYDSINGPNGGQHVTFTPYLSFSAGDTLGWIQRSVPQSYADSFVVNYLVNYIP